MSEEQNSPLESGPSSDSKAVEALRKQLKELKHYIPGELKNGQNPEDLDDTFKALQILKEVGDIFGETLQRYKRFYLALAKKVESEQGALKDRAVGRQEYARGCIQTCGEEE
jgi:hypothetical protein